MPKSKFASQIVGIAEGRATSLGKATNRKMPWSLFGKEMSNPVRTNEKFKAFMQLPKVEQDVLKAAPGWLLGGVVEAGRRRGAQIGTRSLVTLDCDEMTPELFSDIFEGQNAICEYEFFAHTTRKHTAEHPRIRIYILPTGDFPSEKYGPVSRIIAEQVDPSMDSVDDVSFRAAQMMFKPSCAKDQEFHGWHNPGKLVDVDAILDGFRLDWRDYKNLPFSASRGQRRNTADKAENPLSKHGLVGAFCRAYTVEEAMAEFIPDVYIPGDDSGAKPRYSYSEGSTTNGVVVEDDGLFIYSHHGTDPCGETLCNAFDMVRIHLFDKRDEKKPENSNPKNWPSYKALEELVADDKAVKTELLADRIDVDAMFDDISDPDDADEARDEHSDADDIIADLLAPSKQDGLPDLSKYERPTKPVKNWHLDELSLDKNGAIIPSVPNIATIIMNDPRMHGSIARNELSGQIAVRRTISSKLKIVPKITVEDRQNGEDWTDLHDYSIRAMLEAESGKDKPGWGIRVTDRDLNAAVVLVAQRNRFHPAIEYFESLQWDGVSRIDTLWTDYMGTPDTPYYRETSRLFLLAVVCRVFNPGHKWDHAPILKGGQGIRKSTFTKVLFGAPWSGELTAQMSSSKDAVEQMLGKLCLELPELATMRRGEVNDVKEFMTLVEDRVRLSYDRRMSTFRRQVVFLGTTNADAYLKDDTGNRRFWPITVNPDLTFIPTDRVAADRDQIWAEAYAVWRELAMERGYKNIPLVLSKGATVEARQYQEMAQEEDNTDAMAELIREYLRTPTPLSQFLADSGEDIPDFDVIGGEPLVIPVVVTPLQVAIEVFQDDRSKVTSNRMRLAQVGAAMRKLEEWNRSGARRRIPGIGQGHVYELKGRTGSEAELRYRVVGSTGIGYNPDIETDDDDVL